MTDVYLTAVDRALKQLGRWLAVPRRFDTEFNAAITAYC
jgi:hypothetical protein